MTQATHNTPIILGTRGSPLALAQAHETRDLLVKAHGLAQEFIQIKVISTTGDQVQDRPLSEIGGKGLFTKEIEDALLDKRIDIAVHSMKDVANAQPGGLVLDGVLEREDVRDGFISDSYASIDELPQGATVGSSSIRRRAQLARSRPDLNLVEFRGNVQTRLTKLKNGVADATFLAMAGLNRLGNAAIAKEAIAPEHMLPAVAQGAIGFERRADDERAQTLLSAINHKHTEIRLASERSFLAVIDGSCRTPVAGLALLDGKDVWFRGEVLRPDGSECFTVERRGSQSDAVALGQDAAQEILSMIGPNFFEQS